MRFFIGLAGLLGLLVSGAVGAAATAERAKADLPRGQQIATTVCAACHGATGVSAIPANPHLAGQGGDYIAAQLAAFKAGTRKNAVMAGMASTLSPEDMRNVGAWYQMQKPAASVARDKELAMRGQQLWRAGVKASGVPACAGCHGAAGRGMPTQYPALAGQFSELTVGWLKAFASGGRENAVMGPVAAKLSEAEMKAVAEYAAGLR
jgi:cytochrome c553